MDAPAGDEEIFAGASVPVQILDENDKRKHAVFYCHNNIVIPLLRDYLQPFVRSMYDDLVTHQSINEQKYPEIVKHYEGFSLQYISINENRKYISKDKWNFKVRGPVDFSKLFVPQCGSKYKDFTECDESAVLFIIQHLPVFPTTVRVHAEDYTKQVRNLLAHGTTPVVWNEVKFEKAFQLMKDFISSTNLLDDRKARNITKLEEWRLRRLNIAIVREIPVSLNFIQGETTASDHIEASVCGFNRAQEKTTIDKLTQTEPSEYDKLEISNVSDGSIKLDLKADLAIFKTAESFKTAVHKLLEKVIDASGIGPDEVAGLDVEFILPKTLTEEQLKVVATAFPGSLQKKHGGHASHEMMTDRSDVTHSMTDSNIRCLQCVSVLVEVLPKLLQKIMEASMIPPSIIYTKLFQSNIFIRKLTANDRKTLETLLKDGFTKLDSTLIFKIFRIVNFIISPPTRGWNSHPVSSEITIGDDVKRLMIIRNKFLHKVVNEVSENEFEEFFLEVTSVCERVDKFLNCIKTESFKVLVETHRKQPLENLGKVQRLYNDEKSLTEIFITEIDGTEYRVYKAKSLKNIMQELREKPNYTDGDSKQDTITSITLTFPEIGSYEFTQVMHEFRAEINKGLVNITVQESDDTVTMKTEACVTTPVCHSSEEVDVKPKDEKSKYSTELPEVGFQVQPDFIRSNTQFNTMILKVLQKVVSKIKLFEDRSAQINVVLDTIDM